MSRAGEATAYSRVTGSVLQTEAGLVSLGHLPPRGDIYKVVVTEGLHAVIVPLGGEGGGERERVREAKHYSV